LRERDGTQRALSELRERRAISPTHGLSDDQLVHRDAFVDSLSDIQEMSVNTDRIGDAIQDVAGKVQDALTGDTRAQIEVQARRMASHARDAYGEVAEQAADAATAVGRGVEQQPLVALLIAGAVGYALGKLLHPRWFGT
jgi:ElaB/YqjD/DUF883 family membrane-anchored ribosome-binding protein